MNGARNDATLVVQLTVWFAAEDCVRFARPSLAVSHYDSVEPVENVLDHRLCELLISSCLVALHVEHIVKHVVPPVEAGSD